MCTVCSLTVSHTIPVGGLPNPPDADPSLNADPPPAPWTEWQMLVNT